METHEVVTVDDQQRNQNHQWLTAGPDSERASLSASSTKRDSRSELDYAAVDKLPSQAPSETGEDDVKGKGKDKGKKGKDEKLETIPFTKLFRHADRTDKFLIVLGFIGAAANGAGLPVMTIVFGTVYQAYSEYTFKTEQGLSDAQLDEAREVLRDTVADEVIKFLIIGAGVFVTAYFQMACFMYAGQRQARRVRQLFFRSVLRQEIGWFDSISTGDLTTRISGDISVYQEGISEKLGSIIQYVSTFIIGFVIAFTKGWKMSLVLVFGSFPLLAVSGAIMAKAIAASTIEGQTAYASAGSVAEQVISSIRTVVAFGGEKREIQRYMSRLNEAYRVGKKKALISGIGLGVMMFIIFASYGLGFWYGGKLVADRDQTPGEVLNIFFAVVIGAFSLGNAAPHFSSIGAALGAAASLFKVIDRSPNIDSDSTEGKIIQKGTMKGRIEFKDVSFHYPQRPDVPILKDFNLTIEPGQTVALVGTSGSGKSTIVSLLERYYDPVSGSIYLDGEDLKNINLKSLRNSIGMVGQEPVLFSATITQNIKWGATIDEKEPTVEEVTEACRKSNAHDFIMDLSEQYETDVGEKGSLLSGGQKQRIAIARALIKDPPILLLDEATSALDTESERLVQSALDNAASDRTTIVVAHRLSTIKNADKIVVMSKGEILETGRHDELIAQEGVYYGLVRAQELKTAKGTKTRDEDDEEDEESSVSSGSKTGDVTVTVEADEKRPRAMRRMSTKVSTVQSARDEPTEEEIERAKAEKMPLTRVLRLNRPEYFIMFLGAVGASVNGAIMPLFSLAFSAILEALSNPDPDEVRRKANFWAGMFVVLAAVAFFANFGQIGLFALSGERLTRRLRSMTFTAILKQEIGFFDNDKNSTGALTSKLAVDASRVEGLAGSLMGTIIQTVVTLITGLTIAFAYGWKFTLVILGAVPVIGIAAYMELRALGGYGAQTRQAYEQSGQIVQQSISNMRTIAALNREKTFKDMYSEAIRKPFKTSIRHNFYSAVWFAASQGLQYYVWSLAWWYGAELIADGEYDQRQAFNVLFAVLLSAMAIGQMGNFAPNSAKAKISAISIFELIDRKSAIDATEIDEKKERPAPVTGDARVIDGHFVYPARANVPVLRGLSVNIRPGQTVALVGGSGSGKSTVVSLLLRFYDLVSGTVEVEKTPVERWNLEYMRSCFALVGQEPVLFDMTIGENIAYGKVGCTEEEIKQAAISANIHNFISSLPRGYDTPVGEKGTQLSGGQKQRVAIARALIRQPKLLLLDEATSALDSESEKVVQDALDKAASGRTTVTIAHRLSTIQDADVIYVIKKGRVVEVGNHLELIAKKGLYQDLVDKQILMNKKRK